ncbi:hypothetical protein [Chromohalobacter moromii]|uniref:Uncharacterized protein n=1 Tax=Chromohalobacter moromii TaxID=2860329 RepID=A0A9X3B6V5_9GAMM|nr:hypothetical protein [Chromohalobacter moromii]MCT8506128.1 hypothetical protein [Chromohalobacter moromii]
MKIIYTPQDGFISFEYVAEGDLLTATVNGETDTFDFTDMPDGVATEFDTTLPRCPIIKAERSDGVLTVHLLAWYWGSANYKNRLEGEATL